MKVDQKNFCVRGIPYLIRSVRVEDAKQLSEVRVQIDGEAENMDRE